MTTSPGSRAFGRVLAVIALLLLSATPAEAGIRYYAVRFIPQGAVVADGYDLHLRILNSGAPWTALDMKFVEPNANGIARYRLLLNDDVEYELAVSAYVLDGETKLSSPLSNQVEVEAIAEAECAVDDDCGDGDVCNGAERCLAGVCSDGDELLCADPGPCQAAVCDAVQGCLVVEDPDDPACQPEPEPECTIDSDCSDANVCNGTEYCLVGLCAAGPDLLCADPGPCQAAVCDLVQGCLVVEDPDDPACEPEPEPECTIDSDCSDANVCNGSEHCLAGVCADGSDLLCADPGPCQAAVCDPLQGCLVVEDPDDPACEPEPECTIDSDCSDADVCTGAEQCIAGVCWAGVALVCADPGPCEAAVCDAVEGCLIVEDPDDPECESPSEFENFSIDLDGNGEQLGTTGPQRLGIEAGFTLSMWVKPGTLGGGERFLFDAFGVGSETMHNRFALSARNADFQDPIRVTTFDESGQAVRVRDFRGIQQTGEWLHLVLRNWQNGKGMDFFVNGVLMAPSAILLEDDGKMGDEPREIVIGSDYTRLQRFWDGAIGHVALWSGSLGDSEIAEIHAGGHEIDLRADQGAYGSARNLRHYWRLGENLDRLGADFVDPERSIPIHLDQLVGMDQTDVVDDAP